MTMEHMIVRHSKESSAPRELSGSQCLPLAPDAARHTIQTVPLSFGGRTIEMDVQAIQTLLCLLEGYMAEAISGDMKAMAYYRAKDYAEKYGVDEKRFVDITNTVYKADERRRLKHPLVACGMLG